jgi:ketosteroid isomerase-like protein
VLVDGDMVVVNWVFDATDQNGVTRRLEELAIQRWRGDRIAEERFFYDTASAWQVVEPA